MASIDVGFEPRNLLLFGFDRIDRPLVSPTIDALEAEPGVRSAAWTNLPLHFGLDIGTTFVAERASGEWVAGGQAAQRNVTVHYFATMQIPILRGRGFTAADTRTSPCVIIVNESLARAVWPGEEAVGRRINRAADRSGSAPVGRPFVCEVVGVARDARDVSLAKPPEPALYFDIAQAPGGVQILLVRTQEQVAVTVPALQRRLQAAGLTQPPFMVDVVTDLVDKAIITPRFYTVLFGAFAGVATMLAAVGVYGISAYAASRRMREIGIRLVLGAQRGQIIGLVGRGGAIVSGLGILAGMLTAMISSRFVTSLLFEVKPLDPITFVVTPVIVAIVALVAGYLPARRAARLDVAEVLRVE